MNKKRAPISAVPPATPTAPIPPTPKPQAEPTPEAEAFLNALPGRVVASEAAVEGKPRAMPKNAVKGRKTRMEDMLAGLERPPLPEIRPKEPMQRLAVDIPASLHATIKRIADRPGGSLRDDIAALLEWFYVGRHK